MGNAAAAVCRFLRCAAQIAAVCILLQEFSPRTFGENRAATDNATRRAFEQNKRLGRGVNILGYDPIWKSAGESRFQESHFKLIRDAGFNHVRINLHPFRDVGADSVIGDDYWRTLDWAIQCATDNRLAVVLDFHEFLAMAKAPASKKPRFLAMWRQIAEHCKNTPDTVLFEILNEPNGELTPSLWNRLFRETLAIIRQTNPNRTVVVGPGRWNSIDSIEELDLPERDRNIVVTIHYYNPFAFTHQGAPWTDYKDKVGVAWKGDERDRRAIQRDFDRAQRWAREHQRPLYLGEFGAYDKADMASRARYLDFVVREAERRGWSWACWQFDSDFILYDVPNRRWVQPLLNALIPPGLDQNFQANPP